jgi:hypothetical protein
MFAETGGVITYFDISGDKDTDGEEEEKLGGSPELDSCAGS